MRILAVAFSLVSLSLCDARAEDLNAMAQAYAIQATDVARQVLLAELMKHPERIRHVSFTFSLRIGARGRPHDIQIVSKTRNAWGADTARHALTKAKFPPIPKELLRAFGTDGANIHADFDADAHGNGSNQALQPTAQTASLFPCPV